MSTRRRYGKRNAVRQFFINRPDEEMSLLDLIEKFDLCRHTALDIVKELKREGLIEVAHVYRAKPVVAPQAQENQK